MTWYVIKWPVRGPKAQKILGVRNEFADGTLIVRVWLVSEAVPPCRHRFKHAFLFGRPGQRLVLFDNERGKGDHKHIREVESAHCFESIEKLMEDFMAAVRTIQAEESQ